MSWLIPEEICGYPVEKRIGSASFAKVYLVHIEKVPKALKIVPTTEWGFTSLAEIDIGVRIINPHILSPEMLLLPDKDICPIEGYGLILPLGIADVKELRSSSSYPFETDFQIIFQVLQALKCFHHHNILHGDIKPENIIAFPNEEKESSLEYTFKLHDFGNALYLDPHNKSVQEDFSITYTEPYRPPEGFSSHVLTTASDIWALGAMMFNMMTGDFPTFLVKDQILKDPVAYWSRIDRKLKAGVPEDSVDLTTDFLHRMLDLDPDKRSTGEELLKHSLFAKYGLAEGLGESLCLFRDLQNSEIREALEKIPEEGQKGYPLPYPYLTLLDEAKVPLHGTFLTIDLYYMAYPLLQGKKPTEQDNLLFFLTCLGIVSKFYTDAEVYKLVVEKPEYKITQDDLVTTEQEIVKYLGGRLVRKSYYDFMVNDFHLEVYLKIALQAESYLAVDDFPKWAKGINSFESDNRDMWDRVVSASDVIKLLESS